MSFDQEKEQLKEESEVDSQVMDDSAVEASLDENDYMSEKTGNDYIGKPTEYSASVAEQPTTKRDHEMSLQSEMGELEIKSPVLFEMMPESDVKVNETNSSMANLLI